MTGGLVWQSIQDGCLFTIMTYKGNYAKDDDDSLEIEKDEDHEVSPSLREVCLSVLLDSSSQLQAWWHIMNTGT